MAHQVEDEAEIGEREDGGEDVEDGVVECKHIHHHKVDVDGAHPQDEQTPADLPHAANTTPSSTADHSS